MKANKFKNFDEQDKFLQKHNLPKLTKGKKEYLNIPKPTKEMNMSFKILPQRKPRFRCLTGESSFFFFSNFKEEITPIFHMY